MFHQGNFIRSLVPKNVEQEKRRFFEDQNYNPQFEYVAPIEFEHFSRYGIISDEYLPLAEAILKHVSSKFGAEENFLEETKGRLLSDQEVQERVRSYVQKLSLHDTIRFEYSSSFTQRTAIERVDDHFFMRIRLPMQYREHDLDGMLHHEVGTHIMRWVNEFLQPWHGKRDQYQLKDFTQTDEGLGSIHSLFGQHEYSLWTPALYYFTAYYASKESFALVAKRLEPFVSSVERRWQLCLREKRGFSDTSTAGAFPKDQRYLCGVIEVLSWLSNHMKERSLLYLGKIDVSDIKKLTLIAHYPQIVPFFVEDMQYENTIKEIIEKNKTLGMKILRIIFIPFFKPTSVLARRGPFPCHRILTMLWSCLG